MTTTRTAEMLANTYTLSFSNGAGLSSAAVYMLRHDDYDGVEFTVRDAATGRSLGCGDTEDEAEFLAEVLLSQRARGLA